MKKPNPKQTYKALLLDYDALLTYSDDECCYSLSGKEVQILLSFVEYVAWKTRYKTTETEIDQNAISHWSGNLARKLMSGCCPDDETLHRFNEDGVYQSSIDGGLTWQDDPGGDPRNDFVRTPPLPGEPGADKKCAAADNVRGLFKQYRDNLIQILSGAPLLIEIVSGIIAFIGMLAGATGVGIGISVLILGLAAALSQLSAGEVSAAITEPVLDLFRCLVYCRLNSDGELTYEQWQALLGDIADAFDGFVEQFFYQTVNGMGYIGVSNAATMGDSTASDCEDCGCSNLCADKYHIWNGIGGTAPAGTYGTILERDHDRIRVQFNGNYITLEVDVSGSCCVADHWTLVSGGAAFSTAYNDCGTPFTGTAFQHPVAWETHCVELLEMQALGEDRPVVDIFFSSECVG